MNGSIQQSTEQVKVKYLSNILEVQQRTFWEGGGYDWDPFRKVTEFWTINGIFLARNDTPVSENYSFQIPYTHVCILINWGDESLLKIKEFFIALDNKEPGLESIDTDQLKDTREWLRVHTSS